MNRAERRKLQNKITGNMSREAAQEALMEAAIKSRKDAILETAQRQVLIMTIVLHDKFGFDEKMMDEVLTEMEELSDSVNKGRVKVSDLHKIVVDELKIDIIKPMEEANNE